MLATLCLSQGVQSHAEHDKARFVANNGLDSGLCNNRFRPCKTLSYAAQQAAKGDKILLAQGQYHITTAQELFYFSATLVPVLGGFDQVDQYQNQNPDRFVTSLTGVPAQFVEQLTQQGFHVIRDAKAGNQPQKMSKISSFTSYSVMQNYQQNSQCNNGLAAGFACSNIDLLAHVPLSEFAGSPSSANDIWGHVDLNDGKEYAIIGLRNGIAVVDVSDPVAPVIIDKVSGQLTHWRDIKVWQFFDTVNGRWRAYAYATADNSNEGLSIIDLSTLPDKVTLVQKQTLDSSAHNVYISNVDYGLNIANSAQPPLLHISGSNRSNGAFRSYHLDDPTELSLSYQAPSPDDEDYTHDTSSLLLTDHRAQNDCINATADGCRVLLDFNENSLRIWDHSLPDRVMELSDTSYPLAEYTHSGWWTEDKQYLIVHDELDEQTHNLNTTLNIFDISSLRQPLLVGTWRGPTRAIDHNGFVLGNRYYLSNYERGLTVLDISQPANPSQLGFFDTYPVSDNATFNGAWGVYPFLPSGIILVSDINSGLYVLADNTASAQSDQISFSTASVSIAEGDSQQIQLIKTGNNRASVTYQVIEGSASSDDYQITSAEISWAADDNKPQNIALQINADESDEPDEVMFLRLVNPQNGASLGYPNLLRIDIPGIAQTGKVGFSQGQIVAKETDDSVNLTVTRMGGSRGELELRYVTQTGSAKSAEDFVDLSGALTWPDGDSSNKSIQLRIINDNQTETNETFTLELLADNPDNLGSQTTIDIIILDDDSNLPPIVSASGPPQVNTRQTTQLQGRASDPEGRQLSYSWQQISGPNVELNSAESANASFVAPASAAELIFSLSVSDDFGLTTSATVRISVISPLPDNNQSSGGGGTFGLFSLGLMWLWRILFPVQAGNKMYNKNNSLLHTK